MAVLEKALQITHRSETSLEKTVNFSATPYEGQTHYGGAHNPANPTGYSWEGGGTSGTFLKDQAGPVRADLRLISARGSGLGSTFTHEGRGKSIGYSQIKGGRSLRTVIKEARDSGDGAWRSYSSGHVGSSIILPQGVTSRRAMNGEDIITIQSATPDAFLANLSLPQLPYILAKPANDERYAQYFLATNGWLPPPAIPPNPLPTSETKKASTQNALGYPLQGTGQGGLADGNYVDPFAGFAAYRDQATLTVGELMTPAPANDLHFFNNLSSSRVLVEIFTNHVLANGVSLGQIFPLEILTGEDLEHDVLHFEVSGSPNSIINEAAQHGVWRAWWDSRCGFHFVNDYYGGGGGGKVAFTIQDGPSLLGELEINLNNSVPLLNSQRVQTQDFASFGDATSPPMEVNYNMKLGSIYPPGAKVGGGQSGSDPIMTNYMGKNTSAQAYRLFHKDNARTTFTWKNFPYPGLAMGSHHREINIQAKDPKGAWDFSSGKRFVVLEYAVDWQDNGKGGGVYMCSVSGIEI